MELYLQSHLCVFMVWWLIKHRDNSNVFTSIDSFLGQTKGCRTCHNGSMKYSNLLHIYREILAFVDRFMAPRITATGAPLAVRHIQILPMNQYA
jgi:hypothetical protein